MSLYERAKRGLGILALAGASYIGSNSLESRVYADEPAGNIVAAVPAFRGRVPKNTNEAIEQMYSYDFDSDNWAKVVDLGRDNANGYFASLMNDKTPDRINSTFNLLKKEYLAQSKKYSDTFGREVDQEFIKSTESMIKKVKDNTLKTYLLMNVVDTTQSLEEFTRRVQDIDSRDHDLANQYKLAEKKLNLRLLPGGVEYWFGTATKAEVDKLMTQVSDIVHPIHAYSQIPGSGWKTRGDSVLVGEFEITDPEKSSKPITGFGLNTLKEKARAIALRQGFNDDTLVGAITEEEWEQAARGSKTKRYTLYGSMDNLKTIAEINGRYPNELFHLEGSWNFLNESELIKKTPLDRSPYGLVGMVGNCAEFTVGKAKRELNTTPSDDERTADSIVTRYGDWAIEKGGFVGPGYRPLIWSAGISNRGVANDAIPSSSGLPPREVYFETTRMRVAFPKKLKEASSTPIAPPNPPETRTVDPKNK